MSDKPYKFDESPEPTRPSTLKNNGFGEQDGTAYSEHVSQQRDQYDEQLNETTADDGNDYQDGEPMHKSGSVNKPQYKTKVKTQTLDIAQPKTKLPQQVSEDVWEVDVNKEGISLGAATLGFGVVSLIGFFVFEAYTTLAANVSDHPIGTGVLGALLVGFVSCFSFLSFKEWRGYKQVNTAMEDAGVIRNLLVNKRNETSPQKIDRVLSQHGKRFSRGSYAAHCFDRYKQQLQDDMTGPERLGLYEDTVLKPVQEKAHKVLNKESVTAGSLAFISPNNLIQTFAVIWISFRTIRRMARVYGLRPSTAGNWKLLKVLAQNIAAQGVFDLATDEVANQIGGSLSAKFMENSAEAIAAGALNARLGRALIKLLK